MPVSLDLRKAHKHQRHGDLIVVLTWVNDQRALVLMPAMRKDAGWYIVEDSAAWKWGVDHPDLHFARAAKLHAMAQASIALELLGIERSKANMARVISIITGWIPDLIRMPSSPPISYLPGDVGQLILSQDGKPINAEPLRIEDAGANYVQS